MNSLYRGLPDVSYDHHGLMIYGKDTLDTEPSESLEKEMRVLLSVDKVCTRWISVTNVVNIYERIAKERGPIELNADEFCRLDTCLRLKYPDRIRPTPPFVQVAPTPDRKRQWCVII